MRARWAHRRAGRGPGDAAPRGPPSRRSRDAARRGEVRPTPRTRRLPLVASTLFHGGRIHVRSGVSAEALLVRDGRVTAVGRASEVARDAGAAERVDLRGGLMTPGWFDAHVHFMWWGFQMAELDLRATKTVEEALEQIGRRARELAPWQWLTGGRFDKNNWGRWPTAADLDRVTGDRPAVMRSRDGHSRWLNTAALRAAKIGKGMVAPEGGAIFRDASGSPTGVLQERANELADRGTRGAMRRHGRSGHPHVRSDGASDRRRARGGRRARCRDPRDRRSRGTRRARRGRADARDLTCAPSTARAHPARSRGGPRALRRARCDRVDAADPLHERPRPRRPLLGSEAHAAGLPVADAARASRRPRLRVGRACRTHRSAARHPRGGHSPPAR